MLLEYSKSEEDNPQHSLACCFYKRPNKEYIATGRDFCKEPSWKVAKYEVILCDTNSAQDVFITDRLVEDKLCQKVKRKDAQLILNGLMTAQELYQKTDTSRTAARY